MAYLHHGKLIYQLRDLAQYGQRFDQREVMKDSGTAAGDFGVCKALSAIWVKRNYLGEDFWGWLVSSNGTVTTAAKAAIINISRNEVLDQRTLDEHLKLVQETGQEAQFQQAVAVKKNQWLARFLRTYGLMAREAVPLRAINVVEMADNIRAHRGYLLLYILNGWGTGHCVAIYSSGRSPGANSFFDPNFGQIEQGTGFDDFYYLMDVFFKDYIVMFKLGKYDHPRNYRIETVTRKA